MQRHKVKFLNVLNQIIMTRKYFVLQCKPDGGILVNLINKRHGSRILKQMIWPPTHRSHTKVYFNEVVANALRDNIDIVNFGL